MTHYVVLFFLGCRAMIVIPTSKLFKMFYILKRRDEFYHLHPRGSPVVVDLPYSNKHWKERFVRLKCPNEIWMSLKWEVSNDGPNRMIGATLAK